VVQVSGLKSLDEALMTSLTPEVMEGDNKIYCDVCQSKQDMFLGTRFKYFPKILVCTLNRFTFDYETMDRVKLNTYFEFGLEERLTHLVDDGQDH
jgi:ubiquitin C-terminal hydrolase